MNLARRRYSPILSQNIAGARTKEELTVNKPAFTGNLEEHIRDLTGGENWCAVVMGTVNEAKIEWRRLDKAGDLPDEVTRFRSNRFEWLIEKSANFKALPRETFLLQKPTKHWRGMERSGIRAVVGIRHRLPAPFRTRKVYFLWLDMGSKGKAMGNPQQTYLAQATKDVMEHYTNAAEEIETSGNLGSKVRCAKDLLSLLPLAKSLIQFAERFAAGISKSWDQRPRMLESAVWEESEYRFRRPLVALFSRRLQCLVIEGFENSVFGKGRTFAEAMKCLANEIHCSYQNLRRTRSYQRTVMKETRWRLLCELIDVEAYENSLPLEIIRHGKVVNADAGPTIEIKWDAGGRQRISRKVVPPDLAALAAGSRFHALVRFDRRTHHVREIKWWQPLEEVNITTREAKARWERMKVIGSRIGKK